MSQLAENITEDQRVVRLDEPLPAGRRFFRIDSELVEVTGRIRDRLYQRVPDGRRISIRRGQAESARAAHTAGAEVTPYADAFSTPNPFAGGAGGGGVTVDNQTDPPTEVTTLIAPGATISGDEATLPTSLTIYQASVTLTDAQIKALPTTPVALVPAPGATELLAPIAAWLYVDWVADYTNIGDTGRIGIAHIGTFAPVLAQWTNDGSLSELFNLLADGASHVAFAGLEARGTGGTTIGGVGQFVDEPGIVGAGLEIFAGNSGSATGNFTGGNAGNSIKVTIWYGIVDVA